MSITEFQSNIIRECIEKKSGGLSLPMGSGKTIISIIVALEQSGDKPIIIIVSKTLIPNWVNEIKKFYGDTLKYEIFHSEYIKNIGTWKINSKIILTTSETLSKSFKGNGIDLKCESILDESIGSEIIYHVPSKPYLNYSFGSGLLYSIDWGCLIIDEVQNYTNVKTAKCKSIFSLCSKYRWGLSGTIFPEPKIERILGYYLLLNLDGPRTLPKMKIYIGDNFGGLNETMVMRETNGNETYIPPRANEHVISHNLTKEEKLIYLGMDDIMKSINESLEKYKLEKDAHNTRLFSSYKLAMVTYLRQAIICPLIPITSAAIDISNFENKSQLSVILMDKLKELNLREWLSNNDCVLSSRMKEIILQTEEYKDDKLLIFFSYRSCLDLMIYYLKERDVYTITSDMKMDKRQKVINDYANSKNGILLLTYDIGSEGLNLQFSSTIILADFYWNHDICKQAISRCLRMGQKAKEVNIIMFISNTGMENIIFNKHKSKIDVFRELRVGSTNKKISKFTLQDITKFVDKNNNETLFDQILKISNLEI